MEYIYAALVLHAAGKDITEDGVKSVLTAAGVTPDDSRVKALVSSLEGVDIEEAIASAAAAPVAAAAGPAAAAEEEKPEEEEEEEGASEEEAAAGLGALFG